jgi:hypothetical protein
VKVDEVVLSGSALVDNLPQEAFRTILRRWSEMASLTHCGVEGIAEIFASTLIMGGRTAASRNPQYHMEEAEYVRYLYYWLESLTYFEDSTSHGKESEISRKIINSLCLCSLWSPQCALDIKLPRYAGIDLSSQQKAGGLVWGLLSWHVYCQYT